MGSVTSKNWNKVLGLSVAAIVAIGVAFVIGAFAVEPSRAKAEGGYLPPTVLNMPVGNLPARTPDGNALTLLVRIAETLEARKAGQVTWGPKLLTLQYFSTLSPRLRLAVSHIP